MKKNLAFLITVGFLVSLFVYGTVFAAEDNVLVVYTARAEQLNNAVIPVFEKDTGIKVELIVAGTGEVLKRVESEKTTLTEIFSGQRTKPCFHSTKISL